jgi:hypothetical protein
MCLWDRALYEQETAEEMAPEDVIDFFKGV